VRRRGQGRRRSTTARNDRFILLQTLLSRRKTVPQLRSELEEVRGRRTSARTISRRLKEMGLKAYRTKKAPLLQRRHRGARLGFAREHKNWENVSGPMFCSQMKVDFVLIPSTAGKGYIAAEENKMNNLILLLLSPIVEAQ